MIFILFIPLFFAILFGGLSFHSVSSGMIDPSTIKSQTIVPQSQISRKTLNLGTFTVHTEFLPTPTTTPVPTNTPIPTTTPVPSSVIGLGTHGAFNIYTSDEAIKAHKAGVLYNIIDYWGNHPQYQQDWPAEPTTAVGKVLLSYGMKTLINLSGYDTIGVNGDGSIYLNEHYLIQRVKTVYNNNRNPLLGGYWIKDDDQQICNSGVFSLPMTAKLERSYELIRQIDKNPNHVIMAGFCTNADLRKNYHPTSSRPIADAVALYPYPNLYGYMFVGGNINSEVAAEAATIKANTPSGATPVVKLGIYEGFWGDNCYLGIYHCGGGVAPISHTELIKDAKAFMGNGFNGLIDFSFEAQDVNHTGGNDAGMLQYVQDITNYLKSIGKY